MNSDKQLIYKLIKQEDYAQARDLLLEFTARNPADAEACYLLGQAQVQLGAQDEAEIAYRKVTELEPSIAVGHGSLGTLLRLNGRHDEAATSLQRACELLPDDEDYRLELIDALQQSGRIGDAFQACRTLIATFPTSGRGYYALANLCHKTQQHKQAIENYLLAIEHAPELADTHRLVAEAYAAIGDRNAARRHFECMLEQQPGHLATLASLSSLEERCGNLDAAYAIVRQVIDSGRYHMTIGHVYCHICKKFGDCEEAVRYGEDTLTHMQDLPHANRKILHYALGKCYDTMQRYDEAFAHFSTANREAQIRYEPAAHADHISHIVRTYTPNFMMTAARSHVKTNRPVFIVGMPRSGTSLTEQVIGSHPQVAAGGELEDISDIVNRIPELFENSGGYPGDMQSLNSRQLDILAQQYLDRLDSISPDAVRITDKMPHNFIALGLINQILPGARVIHCKRDPLDTCLSIYFQDFLKVHDYANDLGALGTHYRQYLRLMQHWKNVLDIPIIEVEYNDMVDDLEGQARRLIAFCELDWDPACLDFHNSKRVMHTASYNQVTQPVYRGSLQRWRNYEKYLDDLKAGLERDY